MHPPRCLHTHRTATACAPPLTQCGGARAREPHTPQQACRRSGLHMARHMKAASCRLLRSHAAVDGTPHRLMVPHTPPRAPWAAPRPSEEANGNNMLAQLAIAVWENSFPQRCFAPTGGRRFGCCLTPPCPCPHTAPARLAHASPVPLPAWQVSRETLSVLRAGEEGQNHLDVGATRRGKSGLARRGNCAGVLGSPARATSQRSSARRRCADLRPAGAG